MYPVCKDKEKEAREKERERENIMYFSEAINYFKCLQSEKKRFLHQDLMKTYLCSAHLPRSNSCSERKALCFPFILNCV